MDTWTGKDKILHLLLGVMITFLISVHYHDVLLGAYAGAGLAVAKEILDKISYGRWSYKDLIVTLAGVFGTSLCLNYFVF